MKKSLVIMLVLALAVTTVPAFAAQGTKGASARAMERASDESVFHRVGDWFATVGKPDNEKQAIIAERKAKRAAAKAEKEAKKAQKQLKEQTEKMKKKGWK